MEFPELPYCSGIVFYDVGWNFQNYFIIQVLHFFGLMLAEIFKTTLLFRYCIFWFDVGWNFQNYFIVQVLYFFGLMLAGISRTTLLFRCCISLV